MAFFKVQINDHEGNPVEGAEVIIGDTKYEPSTDATGLVQFPDTGFQGKIVVSIVVNTPITQMGISNVVLTPDIPYILEV